MAAARGQSHWLRRVLAFLLAVGLMAVIFYLSSQSTTGISALETGTPESEALRKLLHAAAFGSLWLFLRLAFRPTGIGLKASLWAFFLTVLYAAADEYHQTFTPGRVGAPM